MPLSISPALEVRGTSEKQPKQLEPKRLAGHATHKPRSRILITQLTRWEPMFLIFIHLRPQQGNRRRPEETPWRSAASFSKPCPRLLRASVRDGDCGDCRRLLLGAPWATLGWGAVGRSQGCLTAISWLSWDSLLSTWGHLEAARAHLLLLLLLLLLLIPFLLFILLLIPSFTF